MWLYIIRGVQLGHLFRDITARHEKLAFYESVESSVETCQSEPNYSPERFRTLSPFSLFSLFVFVHFFMAIIAVTRLGCVIDSARRRGTWERNWVGSNRSWLTLVTWTGSAQREKKKMRRWDTKLDRGYSAMYWAMCVRCYRVVKVSGTGRDVDNRNTDNDQTYSWSEFTSWIHSLPRAFLSMYSP